MKNPRWPGAKTCWQPALTHQPYMINALEVGFPNTIFTSGHIWPIAQVLLLEPELCYAVSGFQTDQHNVRVSLPLNQITTALYHVFAIAASTQTNLSHGPCCYKGQKNYRFPAARQCVITQGGSCTSVNGLHTLLSLHTYYILLSVAHFFVKL